MPSGSNNDTAASIGSLSYDILKNLVKPLTHEAVLKAVQREKSIRRKYGKEFVAKTPSPLPLNNSVSSAASSVNGSTANTPKSKANGSTASSASASYKSEINGRIAYLKVPGRDIYGNEKPTNSRYFECDNCKRKVASSRFAAHIERCLSGRNGRQRNYGDSSASPPDASKRPSPNKKRKIDETLPKTQVSKFIDRSKSIHSVPVSRDSSPAMAHRSVSEGPDSFPRKKPVTTS